MHDDCPYFEAYSFGTAFVFAKTYSEKEEQAREALGSGLFQDTGRRGGYIGAPIWKILF